MFRYIKGTLEEIGAGFATIDVGGIGYKIYTPVMSLSGENKLGEQVKLFIYNVIREDTFDLYGFLTENQLSLFEMVISVSGVGPKAGMAILSSVSPETFANAVIRNDAKTLTAAPGIGIKIAQRIVLELKDKMNAQLYGKDVSKAIIPAASAHQDAVSGLMVLGYSQSEAIIALNKVEGEHSLEELITLALQNLGR